MTTGEDRWKEFGRERGWYVSGNGKDEIKTDKKGQRVCIECGAKLTFEKQFCSGVCMNKYKGVKDIDDMS